MKVQLHPDAEEELIQAAGWYEDRRPGLGAELLAEVDAGITILSKSPLMWGLWPGAPEFRPPVRRALLRRYPFAIAYQASADHVVILAIAHTSRRPFYWSARESRSDFG